MANEITVGATLKVANGAPGADRLPAPVHRLGALQVDTSGPAVSHTNRMRRPAGGTMAWLNFTPVPRHAYRLGVPSAGHHVELLNSDSEHYGGSNQGNAGGVTAEPVPSHGYPYSAAVTLPPLGTLWLAHDGS